MDFPIANYKLKKFLGQGAYGTVSLYEKRKGPIQGLRSVLSSSDSTALPSKVAVKIFMSNHKEKFKKEMENVSKIGMSSCDNIVQFFGACNLEEDHKRGISRVPSAAFIGLLSDN